MRPEPLIIKTRKGANKMKAQTQQECIERIIRDIHLKTYDSPERNSLVNALYFCGLTAQEASMIDELISDKKNYVQFLDCLFTSNQNETTIKKPMKKEITHLYSETQDYHSSYSKCGIQLDGRGMQGRVIPGTDNLENVTCKKCKFNNQRAQPHKNK